MGTYEQASPPSRQQTSAEGTGVRFGDEFDVNVSVSVSVNEKSKNKIQKSKSYCSVGHLNLAMGD